VGEDGPMESGLSHLFLSESVIDYRIWSHFIGANNSALHPRCTPRCTSAHKFWLKLSEATILTKDS